MKQYLNQKMLPWLTLVAGVLGLALRFWHLGTENDRGFIIRGHFAGVALLVLTIAFLAVLVFAVQALVQANKYAFNFPASLPGAIGTVIAAACIALTSILALVSKVDALTAIGGLVAAAALVFIGKCRWQGLHPSPIFHIAVCLYFILRLLSLYRNWSAMPQLQEYASPMLAMVCLMVATYHRASFDANMGNRRLYTLFNLAAVYFCCLSLAGPGDVFFYLGAVCYLVTDQCNLTPMPHRFQERSQ